MGFVAPRGRPHMQYSRARDLVELIFGYGLILAIIWMPDALQRILSPIALITTLAVVLLRERSDGRLSAEELGLGLRGLTPSLWILPAATVLAVVSVLLARRMGTLHPLYGADLAHIAGYVIWTAYQQFLLQDYFLPRMTRLFSSGPIAVLAVGLLFATAHLPNAALTAATLPWGIISCALFRRYRNLYALGLAQGLLGLAFAICVPDALHHHMRVGLGYLRYHSVQPIP
jgi:CAAX prenyl protease-like protein